MSAFDFADFPKQFLISPADGPAPKIDGAREDAAAGWRVQSAPAVPRVPVEDVSGARIGLLVGWAILRGRLLPDGEALRLGPGETVPESVLGEIAGRAVCLWRDEAGTWLETDAGGFLPAVWSAQAGLVASTSTLIDRIAPHEVHAEAAAVFDFPRRRGFLPFGLTHHRGVRRLLPSHRLDLSTLTPARVWPPKGLAAARPLPEPEAGVLLDALADRVRGQVGAVARETSPARLYLSGGHDSRMVLAALRGQAERIVCETLVNAAPLDLHLAAKAAAAAGAEHLSIPIRPVPETEREAWLERSGRCIYDPVSDLAVTAMEEDRRQLVMDGTGAEILRASNWAPEDVGAPRLTRDVLLRRARLPEAPVIVEEAEAWLEGLPPCRATLGLDVAKIELIHGCWAGASIYGHAIEIPSISPFASRPVYDAALRLPEAWKAGSETYRRWMARLWPEGAEISANRAEGWDRLRFAKSELKRLVPASVKRALKPYR